MEAIHRVRLSTTGVIWLGVLQLGLAEAHRALVRGLHRPADVPSGVHLLDGGRSAHQRFGAQQRVLLGQGGQHSVGVGSLGQPLDTQGHLNHHLGQLVGRFADVPAAVGGLAPGGPVDRDVGPDPGRLLLAGEAVGGLPGDVAEEDVDLETLLHRLALEQRLLERPADGADDIDEEMIEHDPQRIDGVAGTIAGMGDRSVWLDRRVIAYAHQGGAWESPSSTLFAIRRAMAAGADAIELDVHATADGQLVVCHDATVDRTTAATGNIVSFTLAELRRLDFSYWFIPGADVTPDRPDADYPYRGRAPDDPAFGIATLREVLEHFPGVLLNLDIKQTAPVVAPYEATLARLLAEFERSNDVIVASFLDPATDAFRTFAPGVPTSAGTIATAEFWQAEHGRRGAARVAGGGLPGARAPGRARRGGPGLRGRGPPLRTGGPRVDGQRHRVHGAPARARGRRHHQRRADHALVGRWRAPGPVPAWPGTARRRGARVDRVVSPSRSWASCRGWPSSWRAACASQSVST